MTRQELQKLGRRVIIQDRDQILKEIQASLNFIKPQYDSDSSATEDDQSVSSEYDSMNGADQEEFVSVEHLNQKKIDKQQ